MTLNKRREWARVFIGARHHGLSRLRILLFSVECARQLGTWVPFLVAMRVVLRVEPIRGLAHAQWNLSPMWAPRALGAIAVGIALWGILSLHRDPIHVDSPSELPIPETVTSDWLTRDGGFIAVPIPSKRLERQQAPPCAPLPSRQVEINGGCWMEVIESLPCGQFYEHQGRCYVPVRETPKPPTSVVP